MAKTSTERMRELRARQKAQAKAERLKPTPVPNPLISRPSRSFATFLKEREANFMLPENLHWVGIEIETDLMQDQPKLDRTAEWQELGLEVNSLTVATAMAEILIDSAKELSGLINAYKLEEIDRQMQNASPVKKGQLEALKKRLGKKTSHFFPVIE
ncbi:hypothetical protein O9X90_00800 [Agrobacterium leguminum]|uniref:hypothetical protein n=1 Tax=Agrobacterium TaxID=357 RepID=UPI0022B8153F|nr:MULTISPECIES: hypothetical protein [Agrobacterium]MCZ7930839.1 hypothetical protein [Agrobacterium leguminum]MDR5009444.1 hypothetical protein [Agrobacterium tumefaciens]